MPNKGRSASEHDKEEMAKHGERAVTTPADSPTLAATAQNQPAIGNGAADGLLSLPPEVKREEIEYIVNRRKAAGWQPTDKGRRHGNMQTAAKKTERVEKRKRKRTRKRIRVQGASRNKRGSKKEFDRILSAWLCPAVVSDPPHLVWAYSRNWENTRYCCWPTTFVPYRVAATSDPVSVR